MKEENTTIRAWQKTLRKLRMLHALTGESMVVILDRLVSNELERVRQEQAEDEPSQGIQV